MSNLTKTLNDESKILADINEFSEMGFVSGYFRLEKQIDSSSLPSLKLRRQFIEHETKHAKSTDSYEDIEQRKAYIQELVNTLEIAEADLIEKFAVSKRRGTDAFFGSVLFTFLLAIIATQTIEDQNSAASLGLNVLSVFPLVYIPLYIFMKKRVKKLYEKAHAAQDLSWVFRWEKT